MKQQLAKLLISSIVVLAVACGTESPAATPISTVVQEPTPTVASPTPTTTPRPSPTPTSSPTPVSSPAATPHPITLDLTPQWAVGQSWDYEILKTSERRTGSEVTRENLSTSVVNIEVLDANENGFVLGYTLKSVEMPRTRDLGRDEFVLALARLTADLTFEVEVGPDATPRGLKNYSDIVEAIDVNVELLLQEVSGDYADDESLALVRSRLDPIRDRFDSEQKIVDLELLDFTLFLIPFGWEMEVGALYEVDNSYMSPLDGTLIEAVALIDVSDPDPGDTVYTFTWTQDLSGAGPEQFILELSRILVDRFDGESDGLTPDLLRGIARQDKAVFEIDTTTWTLLDINSTEQISVQDRSSLDITRMTLLP